MEEETIDLKKYFRLLKRWLWLLILGLILGSAAAYGGSRLQTPVYQAVTKLMVTRGRAADQSLDIISYYNATQLSQTYLQLLQTDTVLNAAAQRLAVDLAQFNVEVSVVRDTSILDVAVEHTDPALAATLANTLVEVLIEKNEEIQSVRYVQMEASLQAQKSQLETQIASLQEQITQASRRTVAEQERWLQDQISSLEIEADALAAEIPTLGAPVDPALRAALEQKQARLDQVNQLLPLYKKSYNDLLVYGTQVDAANTASDAQLSLLNTTLALYQQIYQSVLSNLESVRLASLENTPSVVPIEVAAVPQVPVRPRLLLNTALGGLTGFMLVIGVLVLNEYLDTTIKTAEEVEELLGLNVIGLIAQSRRDHEQAMGIYVSREPRSPFAEAYRSLRTNIEFSSVDRPIKTILVTSPDPSSGKTTVSANLAAIFSQKDSRVLLIDADLRRPSVHLALEMNNRLGLTDILRGTREIVDVIQAPATDLNMAVITSGALPPNPAELLSSAKMSEVIDRFSQRADVIVIDSPPSLVADAQVLASRVDAVLLVAVPGETSRESLKNTVESLRHAGARIIGVVFNRVSRDRLEYYGDYYYYHTSENKDDAAAVGAPPSAGSRRADRLARRRAKNEK
jgi:non-specific protein-tyrosine kinase